MNIETYACTNSECGELTDVRFWPATRTDPADSTWGDGCKDCGAPLQDEPVEIDPPEPDYEAMQEAQQERRTEGFDDREEW